MDVVADLCRPLARRMWALQHGSADAPHLVLPVYRTDAVRVSEQESKILLCQVLESTPWFYSIETPTRERYRQTGVIELSARIDVTVYASRNGGDRLLNVELKAGMPGLESFRKDFEKLARERVEGLWFHTLAAANRATLPKLLARMRAALEAVAEHTAVAEHGLTIALCTLRTRELLTARIELGPGLAARLDEFFDGVGERWLREVGD